MTQNWQGGLNEALISYVITHGGLVREDGASEFGWQEYGWDEGLQEDTPALTVHMRTCAMDLARSSWTDSDWQEFCGTFAEPPVQHRTGTDAVVWCRCGAVNGRRWRYTGGLAALIRAITGKP